MKRKLCLAVASWLAARVAGPARAAGEAPFEFLAVDAQARAAALGGAYGAVADDAGAISYNPAGLSALRRHEASFTHNEHFAGVRQEHLLYGSPLGLALGLDLLDSGAIPRTTVSNPDGTGLGEARLRSLALSAGYGRFLGRGASLGGAVKWLSESIDGAAAQAPAVDLGALYAVPWAEGLTLAAAVQNLGPSTRYESARAPLPATARLGTAYSRGGKNRKGTAAIELLRRRGEGVEAGLGLEALLAGTAAVRLGWSSRLDSGPGLSAGLGWRGESLRLDYALVPFGGLGMAHRLTAGFLWGAQSAKAGPGS